ncbi:MAG: tyrosine-type recombinase/integrase, partial [Actinomycetes bacterium]
MPLTGTTYKRCACKDPDTGKDFHRGCPNLSKRRHGTWTYDTYIDTTAMRQRRLRRGGFATQTAAQAAMDEAGKLIELAGGDQRMAERIGDLIVQRTKHGGQLPSAADVRRKLGAGADLAAPDATVGEWLDEWLVGKRGKKENTRTLYEGHVEHYFKPLIGDIPRDKLRVEHVAGVFDTIEEWNDEIRLAKREKRKPHLPDDPRKQLRIVGIASQHRILGTLRNAYNVAVRRPGMIDWNPCLAVELPPETRDPARVWSPEQVVQFLEHAASDRLGLLYRIILLRGPRRGEALGLLRADLAKDPRRAPIRQTILQIAGRIVWDTPKTAAGVRVVSLDSGTAELVPAHLTMLKRERLAAGEAYQDHGLFFCREDGTPLSPDSVSKYFKRLAAAAGVPVIRLHEARHTAATLGLEAGLDIKIVSDQLGHSTTRIT